MSIELFDYPQKGFFGKAIPKTKFYEHGNVSNKLKDLFVKQVEQITWIYKLAPETINVQATKDVAEIQVFEIALKDEDLSEDILLCIDKAVQYPIIFEIKSRAGIRSTCAVKMRLVNGSWRMGRYLQSKIYPKDVVREKLNVSLNLKSIYEQIICAMCDTQMKQGEGLEAFVERDDAIQSKKALIKGLKNKIQVEKQFKKKVELNSKLRIIVEELNQLLI